MDILFHNEGEKYVYYVLIGWLIDTVTKTSQIFYRIGRSSNVLKRLQSALLHQIDGFHQGKLLGEEHSISRGFQSPSVHLCVTVCDPTVLDTWVNNESMQLL